MSDADDSDRRSSPPLGEEGVLANLPHTRPQRASRRRTEAREATVGAATPGAAAARPGDGSKLANAAGGGVRRRGPAVTAKRPRGPSAGQDSVPRQGFESESGIASGSVQPPGAAEVVASVAEVVGELTKAGLSAGERLLKDFLARLPRP
jgi:hypothetical protein